MFNVMQVQHALKSVHDNDLVNYVKSPTPDVPQYVALAELSRRKQLRESAAPQAGQPAEPQKTVADQMTERSEAEKGIAALPTGDMYQDKHFNNGGVVGFSHGGKTNENKNLSEAEMITAIKGHTKVLTNKLSQHQKELYDRIKNMIPGAEERELTKPVQVNSPKAELAAVPGTEVKAAPKGIAALQQAAAPQAEAEQQSTLPTAEEETARIREAIGTDPGVAENAAGLETLKARAAQNEAGAQSSALGQGAGAMLQNTSQFFGPGLGQGVTEYYRSMKESKQGATTSAEKYAELQTRLAAAQRAENVAMVKYGEDSAQAKTAAAQAERLVDKKLVAEKQMHKEKIGVEREKIGMQGAEAARLRAEGAGAGTAKEDTYIKEYSKYASDMQMVGKKPTPYPQWKAQFSGAVGAPAANEFAGFKLVK